MQSLNLHRLGMICMKVFYNSNIPRSLIGYKLTKASPTILSITNNSVRGRKNWLNPYYAQLYRRRLEAGPEPERHRSAWSNWNYNAELYAFAQRLGEQFNDDSLRQAFTNESYIHQEEDTRARLGVADVDTPLSLDHNESLSLTGREFTSDYIKLFLHTCYPRFPEEGITHVHNYLLAEDVTSFVAHHFGMNDLILCASSEGQGALELTSNPKQRRPGKHNKDFPCKRATLSKTLFAVIGALLHDQGSERAAAFVSDLLITQLIGQDINELWPIINPMGLLTDILASQDRPEPEPRLTRHTGDETVMSVYFVAIYCDKQLIGEAPGETVPIAEEMAARDALKRIFGTEDHRSPLQLGKKRPKLDHSPHLQESEWPRNISHIA